MLQSVKHTKRRPHGGIGNRRIVQLAAQQTAQCLDSRAGPGGQVRQRSVLDLAVFAVGFAQQDSGGRVAIGNLGDIHADMIRLQFNAVNGNYDMYMTTLIVAKSILLPENSITLLQT